MSPIEAQAIIDALANGVDPGTGELLSSDGPLGHAPVVRALFVASRALSQSAHRARLEAARPGKAGKPWSQDEDTQLLQAFDDGTELRDLASRHERSAGGIRSRLVHLGRLREAAGAQ